MDDIRISSIARYNPDGSSTNVVPEPPINIFQPTQLFGGVQMNYQPKRIIPSVSSSGVLEATDLAWVCTPLSGHDFESTTINQTSITGMTTGKYLIGGHVTTLKSPSGDFSILVDAEL